VHCELLRRIVVRDKFIAKSTEDALARTYVAAHALPLATVIDQVTRISKAGGASTGETPSGENTSALGIWMSLWEALQS
jgi:hypothetical protein